MQITNAQVGNVLYALVEGQPLPIAVGETIKVSYTFKYRMPETASVRIWASLYTGVLNRLGQAQTKETVTLVKSLEWKDYSGTIDIVVGQASAGEYGLVCELPDYPDAGAHIDDCISVTAAPGILDMMGPLLGIGMMMMVMSMIMPKEEEGTK